MIRDYSYGVVIGALFLGSIIGHWVFGWFEYVDQQNAHSAPVVASEYFVQLSSRTLENWQSEFLQLLCQVGLLAWLLFKGSPQSKDEHDRMEHKLDEMLKAVKELDDRMGRH